MPTLPIYSSDDRYRRLSEVFVVHEGKIKIIGCPGGLTANSVSLLSLDTYGHSNKSCAVVDYTTTEFFDSMMAVRPGYFNDPEKNGRCALAMRHPSRGTQVGVGTGNLLYGFMDSASESRCLWGSYRYRNLDTILQEDYPDRDKADNLLSYCTAGATGSGVALDKDFCIGHPFIRTYALYFRGKALATSDNPFSGYKPIVNKKYFDLVKHRLGDLKVKINVQDY